MSKPPVFSVVAPVFNEADSLPEFIARTIAVMKKLGETYELIIVDDGSKDQTSDILLRHAARDKHIRPVLFARNFGHQIAVTAGMDYTLGQAVILIDADLQDPPEVIPELVANWRDGFEVVYAVRRRRKGESFFKRFTAAFFYRLINRITDIDIPLDTGDFRLMDRRVVDVLNNMREHHRFLRGMSAWVGFRQVGVPYDRAPRFAGETHYTLGRMIKLALTAITGFSFFPLQLATYLGFFSAGIAIIAIPIVIALRVLGNQAFFGQATTLLAVLFFGGAQLISLGVLGEYIGRLYDETRGRPLYILRNNPEEELLKKEQTMIDLTVMEERLKRGVEKARKQNIIIPTFAQQKNPQSVPDSVKKELASIGLWDVAPRNLFRITWKNQPKEKGGGYGDVNYIEFPPSLTGVNARIIALVGKWFPTGAHKVGAAFACLVPRLVTGQFDPSTQKAVWPSTGNYCRGGAYDSALLGCQSIAILPEGMSKERFDWLAKVAGEVIKTPGSESNVKEIFDKCWELRKSGQDLMIFNQFEEFGNYLWHYEVTGHAMEDVLERELGKGEYRGVALTTGSAGTIASGDHMKQAFPASKVAACEALQCPTLLENGFGSHRIEGIGDKHVPWIHNVKNTDMVIAIDDNAVVNLARLFNEPAGRKQLVKSGVPESFVSQLNLLGFSGIANVLSCIKMAKHYELGPDDVLLTVLTDSMDLYGSRLQEMHKEMGEYTEQNATADQARYLLGENTDNMLETNEQDRRRIHNLKYYTWVEQQGRTYEEIRAQWEDPDYWTGVQRQAPEIDSLINEFNQRVGLMN